MGATLETAIVDATDEKAVENHMNEVIKMADRVDISFNAIGLSQKHIQGNSLTELPLENFMHPISTYTQAHFLTARAALKRMVKQGQGVILMQTPDAGKVSQPFVGGIIPAWAAMEGLCRSISVEFGQQGVRAICLRTTAIPETPLIDEVFDIHGKVRGVSFHDFQSFMESMTHRKRLTSLGELTNAAVFAASNEGSALTGSVLNLTAGMTAE
jgi:NAD(P)-dependent dehydrogenase (short-subunit alcohol dehydrogenase family)